MGCALTEYQLKKVIKAYGELSGDLHLVNVDRGSNGLGLSLVGNRDLSTMSVFVAGIRANSTTAKDGRIHVGDELLEANGHVIYGRSHLNASAIIKGIHDSKVKFILLRRADVTNVMAIPPISPEPPSYKEDPNTLIPRNIQISRQGSATSLDSETSLSNEPEPQSAPQENGTSQEVVTSSKPAESAIEEQTIPDFSQFQHLKAFTLHRGSQGLGFAIREGSETGEAGIYIKTIQPNSPAAECGELHVGDQLVLVEGNPLLDVSYDKAIQHIRSCRGAVNITVNQRTASNQNSRSASISSPANQITDTSADSSESGTQPSIANSVLPQENVPENQEKPMQEISESHAKNQSESPKTEEPSSQPAQEVSAQPIATETTTTTPIATGNATNQSEATTSTSPKSSPSHSNATTTDTKPPTTSSPPPPQPSPSPPPQPLFMAEIKETEVEEDPATVAIVAGRETVIEIQKGRTGLGLSIVGGADTMLGAIIIHEVYEDGAAARDGRLWAGDQILEVNGECLRDATHERAIAVLRQTPSVVRMVVFRDDAVLKDDEIYDIFTVDLMKKPGKGLGLSIVGRRGDTGVFISDIVKGGVADSCGNLRQGDQILKVNTEDLKDASQEHAAALLKTLMGKVTLTIGRLKGSSSASSRRSSGQMGNMKKSESSLSNSKGKYKHSKTASIHSPTSSAGSSSAHVCMTSEAVTSHPVTLLSYKAHPQCLTSAFSTSSMMSGSGSGTPVIREVTVARDSSGSLGLSIAGGRGSALGDMPIIVASLAPHGAAALCGEIKEGDHILSINGVSTANVTHQDAVQMLKSTQAIVKLHLVQGEDVVLSNGSHDDSAFSYSKHGYLSSSGTSDLDTSANSSFSAVPGQVRNIRLERGSEGLGFSIVGGHSSPHGNLPIYIKTIFEQGAAARSGTLRRGDQLLAVNEHSLEGVTRETAVAILKSATGAIDLKVMS